MITEAWSQGSCGTLNSLSQAFSLGRRQTVPTRGFNENLSSWTKAIGLRARTGVTSDSTSCKSKHRMSEVTCLLRVITTQESEKQRWLRCGRRDHDAPPQGTRGRSQQLLDPALCVYWTPHSPRSFMSTCCAALGVAKVERNILGRWAQNG